MAKPNSTRSHVRKFYDRRLKALRARSQSDPKALKAAANQIASEAFQNACNEVCGAAAVLTPRGSINRTVDLYLAAMRKQLEWHERSWAAQQARP